MLFFDKPLKEEKINSKAVGDTSTSLPFVNRYDQENKNENNAEIKT